MLKGTKDKAAIYRLEQARETFDALASGRKEGEEHD